MVDEMRTLPPRHGSMVANVDGGSLFDTRLPGVGIIHPTPTPIRFGPFEDISAFHLWLRDGFDNIDNCPGTEVADLVTMHKNTDWGLPVFTHGDLSSLNVLIRGEDVVGVVDWETAG